MCRLPVVVAAVLVVSGPNLPTSEARHPDKGLPGGKGDSAEHEPAESRGVAWPIDYSPVLDPAEPPSRCFALPGPIAFPETRLPPVNVEALLEEDRANARLGEPPRVGIGRPLDEPVIGVWQDLPDGGRLWTAAVVAEGALELRLHFADVDLPPGAELYLYSPEHPDAVIGPYGQAGPLQRGEFWAGAVPGNTAYVEYYVPDGSAVSVPFRIDEAGHMYRRLDGTDGSRAPLDCMGDIACYPEWEDVSYSVARIYVYSDGSWVLCTGSLLAAQNGDLTPYFLTSAHCVDSQGEANTAQFRWFYQHDQCQGTTFMVSPYSYDADLLGTSGNGVGADWTLLMVKGVLPPGVFWSGWTSSNPSTGTWSVGVHHPDADWKRYSRGRRYSGPYYYYHQLRFNVSGAVGHIYYGSSGSGIWTESDQKLFGNLSFSGGEGGCDNINAYAYYGRFSTYYSSIASLLNGGSDDTFEDNDTCVNAFALGSGGYPNLVVKSVDEDWYRVTLGYLDQLDVLLTFTDLHGNIDVELYDACGGSVVASGTSTNNNESLTYVNPGAVADFHLRVYLADDTRNTYEMDISGAFFDCNGSGLDDACDIDCQAPGCNLPGCGQSFDCNSNGIPDECESDCNTNGIADDCEAAELIVAHPLDVTSCPGTTVSFTVTTVGATSHQWYKDGSPLSDGGDISGATTDMLVISNVDAADEGFYECRVNSGCIETYSDPALLSLHEAPAQSGTLPNLDKCEGEPATFIADFTGTPPLSYQWEKDTVPIPGEQSNVLTIDPATPADAGEYRCKAVNTCGFAYTNTATLTVDPAPTITDQPDDTCAEVGETAVFTVAATGQGNLWYQWLKDGFDIPGEGGWDHTTLTLTNVQPGDVGQYSVYVVSSVSPACLVYSDEATLTVGGCGGCEYATPGDMDGDTDVDLYDFARFQACFGPGMGLVSGCECANMDDSNDDVDLSDYSLWNVQFNGPA